MISVVISTRQKDLQYLKRIEETAGVPVQLLVYENNNQFSLTELYNKGLDEATSDVVVFMHDDLVLEGGSKWGEKIHHVLTTTEYGIVGKAGTTHLPDSAQWWGDASAMVGRVHHQQIHPQTGKPVKWLNEYSGNFGENIVPVTVVDGLIFGVNKTKIKARFDETIKGFHLYDVDFCIANFLEGVKIGVLFNFNITHKSIGQTNQEWEFNRYQVANKYDGRLPLSVDPILFAEERNVKIKKQPFVSIIIPTKGKVELVGNLLASISTTSYQNYEVIVADTGSSEEEMNSLREMIMNKATIEQMNIRMVEYDYYHFAKINNDVVKNHLDPKAELVMFCNNDVVFVNDCLSLMVDTHLKNRHTCGTVGARLHFENNKVQHAGIFIAKRKDQTLSAGHVGYNTGYQYQNKTYTVVGNTAALLLISKTLFEKIGGFNELYAHCFEDVELNLQALMRRCTNYLCGEAVAYHLESQSREPGIGVEDLEKLNLFMNNNMDKLAKYLIEQ